MLSVAGLLNYSPTKEITLDVSLFETEKVILVRVNLCLIFYFTLKGCTHRTTEALRLKISMHRKGLSICGYTSLLR